MYYNKNERNSRGDNFMSNEKKLSMQEKVQQHLEKKKQAQSNNKNKTNMNASTPQMKSQQTKRPSNTRRKMGS